MSRIVDAARILTCVALCIFAIPLGLILASGAAVYGRNRSSDGDLQ